MVRIFTGVGAFIIALLMPLAASAQALSVEPVTIHMPAGQMATAVTVRNSSSSPVSFQVRAFQWSQATTSDIALAPTDVLLASPPLGTIAPNGSQIVRLLLRRPADQKEATYRMLFDEIPSAAAEKAPLSVRIIFRLSIPVFAEPSQPTTSHLQWQMENDVGGTEIVATNVGSRHTNVRSLTLQTSDGHPLKLETPDLPFVLAGASRHWRVLTPVRPGTTLRLTAGYDNRTVEQAISSPAVP